MEAVIPSGSTNGRPIALAATATPGTLLHTATSTAGQVDEVYVWLANIDTETRQVTLEVGGTGTSDQWIVSIDAKAGGALVLPGIRFNGGVAIRAFADSANKVNATVIVNRITV